MRKGCSSISGSITMTIGPGRRWHPFNVGVKTKKEVRERVEKMRMRALTDQEVWGYRINLNDNEWAWLLWHDGKKILDVPEIIIAPNRKEALRKAKLITKQKKTVNNY